MVMMEEAGVGNGGWRQKRNQERKKEAKILKWKISEQETDLVLSRESMPTKDMGTTNDATTIKFHANQSMQMNKITTPPKSRSNDKQERRKEVTILK